MLNAVCFNVVYCCTREYKITFLIETCSNELSTKAYGKCLIVLCFFNGKMGLSRGIGALQPEIRKFKLKRVAKETMYISARDYYLSYICNEMNKNVHNYCQHFANSTASETSFYKLLFGNFPFY